MSFFKLNREKMLNDTIERLKGVGTNEVNLDGYSPLVCKIPIGLCNGKVFDLTFGSDGSACASYMITGDRASTKSILDAIIINGCLKYTPGELSFRLYDVESGGMLEPYEEARLPHIARIGSCLCENEAIHELSRLYNVVKKREELFKELSSKCGNEISNIYEYNKYARTQEKGAFKHKKRIIVVLNGMKKILNSPRIDERYATQLCRLVEDIAKKGTSLGVHLILTSTGFTNDGFDLMLKSTYVEGIDGIITFTQGQKEPRVLGFGKSFAKRIREITKMEPRQALITTDGKNISKVDIAILTPIEEYIERISDSTFFFAENTEKLSKK
ncbi:MAG: hypothetical protein IJ400_05290 [Clostridia bacterium]|nr:hypothetical protein [Clostridia bacterium]